LSGGASVCAEASVPIAGGHSIDSVEPIYGLVALGVVDPAKVQKNSTARAGDKLILTKALGVGVLSAAFKQEPATGQATATRSKPTSRIGAATSSPTRKPAAASSSQSTPRTRMRSWPSSNPAASTAPASSAR
jgi:selenophosphate synthase